MTATPWAENDRLFRTLLERGQRIERYVADVLCREGFDAYCPEQTVREHIRQAPRYRDQIDVLVRRVGGAPVRLEVKERPRVAFTSPLDIPAHLLPFFVTTVDSWHNCAPASRPHAICVLSGVTGCILATRGNADNWCRVQAYDTVRNGSFAFYAAPRSAWRTFGQLTQWLERARAARA